MFKILFSILFIFTFAVVLSGCVKTATTNVKTLPPINNQSASQNINSVLPNQNVVTNVVASEFSSPLDRPSERITKKPFGIYITPRTSPVQPERFSGYHTGADFEILPGEENIVVTVKAFCPGKVVSKQRVGGYGGVLIQQCTVDNQMVTALYGHLKLASIEVKVGDQLTVGEAIGELGQANSYDTDGERKHLHFGIHKGSTVNVGGYVSKQGDLGEWLDPQNYL